MKAATQQIAEVPERRLSLFDIEHEKADLIAFRDECETDEERAAVDQQIQEYVGREIRKVTGIAALLRYFKSMGEVAKAEQERAAKHRARWERAHDRLKAMVLGVMQAMDVPKLEAATDRLRRQKNPVALEITDAKLIPDQYLRATIRMPYSQWLALMEQRKEWCESLINGGEESCPTLIMDSVVSEVDTAAVKAALAVKATCGTCKGTGSLTRVADDKTKFTTACDVCNASGSVWASVPGARLTQSEHLRVE